MKDAWVEGMSVQVTLIVCYDRYEDFIGGTLIARRNNLFHSAAVRFGIASREKQIAPKLMLGYSNPEIAERFSIAPRTVKPHVHNIYQKTGAANRVELGRRVRAPASPGKERQVVSLRFRPATINRMIPTMSKRIPRAIHRRW